jgi:FkbM family methyltransferase
MPDEVVQTPFGAFLIDTEECIGSTLKAGTLWDGPGFLQPIALEYGELGTPGVTILDVGANLGAFSVWLARRGAWRVIAVEPVHQTLRYLRANLDLNKDVCGDHVIRLEVAAYDRVTDLYYTDPGHDLGGTAVWPSTYVEGRGHRIGPYVAHATPLDNYQHLYGDRVSLIKIDAQGCDGRAILGLSRTIERDHPAVVFEWEEELAKVHGYSLETVVTWFTNWGYRVSEWQSHPHNFLATVPK